jgi:gamma-glutamyltranspeptidase
MPDETYVEPGFAPAVLQALRTRGHTIVPTAPHTSANSIVITAAGYTGAPDSRTRGAAAVGY